MYHVKFAVVLYCMILLTPAELRGDSWAAATPMAVASPDAERLVRIVPGNSLGDTFGFAGSGKGSFVRATYYVRDEAQDTYAPVRTIDLLNPISPVEIFLNNTGVLVSLDNWHNAGYGSVVAIYDGKGRLLKSYELEDLYSETRIGDILQTVSSRWWRCASVEPWINDVQFWMVDTFGGEFRFDLNDGSFEYEKAGIDCESR